MLGEREIHSPSLTLEFLSIRCQQTILTNYNAYSPGSLVAIRLFGKRKLWVHERHISAVRASYGGVGLVFCRPENVFQGPCQVSGFGPFGVHSGVKLGDWIFNIDGQDIGDKNMDEVTDLLRGEPGSNVLIKVYSKSIFQVSRLPPQIYLVSDQG